MIQSLTLPKIAFIDLDGALIDASVRFKRAEDLRRAHPTAGSKESWNYYWEEALNPAFFHLDTEIAGAKEHLAALAREGYALLYISSRQEHLRQATALWLHGHGFPPPTLLLLKVRSFVYQKSPNWYAWMAETLAQSFGCTEMLVVSDKQANLAAIRSAFVEGGYEPVRYYTSLAGIFEIPAHGADDPDDGDAGSDPFLPDFPPGS